MITIFGQSGFAPRTSFKSHRSAKHGSKIFTDFVANILEFWQFDVNKQMRVVLGSSITASEQS